MQHDEVRRTRGCKHAIPHVFDKRPVMNIRFRTLGAIFVRQCYKIILLLVEQAVTDLPNAAVTILKSLNGGRVEFNAYNVISEADEYVRGTNDLRDPIASWE